MAACAIQKPIYSWWATEINSREIFLVNKIHKKKWPVWRNGRRTGLKILGP